MRLEVWQKFCLQSGLCYNKYPGSKKCESNFSWHKEFGVRIHSVCWLNAADGLSTSAQNEVSEYLCGVWKSTKFTHISKKGILIFQIKPSDQAGLKHTESRWECWLKVKPLSSQVLPQTQQSNRLLAKLKTRWLTCSTPSESTHGCSTKCQRASHPAPVRSHREE